MGKQSLWTWHAVKWGSLPYVTLWLPGLRVSYAPWTGGRVATGGPHRWGRSEASLCDPQPPVGPAVGARGQEACGGNLCATPVPSSLPVLLLQ